MMNKATVPKDWDITTIGTSCDILDYMRIPVKSSDRFERKGDIPYYGANGLLGWIDDYIYDEELVLIAEDGGYFDEFSNRPIAYMIRGKTWVNNHAHVLRARKQIASNHWIFYNLVHRDIQYYIQGGTRSKLNQSELRNIEVPLPSLPEQRSIAEILDTIDETIQKTEALISKLKAMKQGLLHDLLTRGLDKNGKLRDPKAHPEQFKEWALGRVPINWEVNRLGKFLARIDQGWSPDCDSDPAPQGEWGVLKTTAVVWEGYRGNENKRLPKAHKPIPFYEVRVDDVLMTRGGPNSRVGVVALVHKTQGRLMLSDKIYRLVHNDDVSPAFLTYALSGNRTQRHLSSFKTGMAESQTNISQEIVRSLFITVPSKQEQYIIVETLTQYGARIRTEEQYRDKLKLQKKGLMNDLLTGKVRVRI